MAVVKLMLIADNYDIYRKKLDSDIDIIMITDIINISPHLINDTADLLIIDTDKTGIIHSEVCSLIKTVTESNSTPVLVITSDKNYDVVNEFYSAGCSDVVINPIEAQDLSFRIKLTIKNNHKMKRIISDNNELNLFFAAAAHDLKSPVNSLIMLADVLKDEAVRVDDSAVIETVAILSSKAAKLSAMIDSLMSFSKICNVVPEFEDINIELLFEDVYNDLTSIDPSRDITLKMDTLPSIWGDDVMIEMLIENLLSNAIKFTAAKDKALIEVRYRCDEVNHIISVKDNGIGFDMADSMKIFQIFERLHESEKYDGNGVGLAMCRRIMTRHGGKIDVKSSLDNGAEFILYFPIQRNEAEIDIKMLN